MDEPRLINTVMFHAKALEFIPKKDTAVFLRKIAKELDYISARVDAGGEEDCLARQVTDLKVYLREATKMIEDLLRGRLIGEGIAQHYRVRIEHFKMVSAEEE